MDSIRQSIRSFILTEFLPGEDPALLTDATPLVTGGILDSLATVQLAAFIIKEFHVELAGHEMSGDYLNTIADIVRLVESKQAK